MKKIRLFLLLIPLLMSSLNSYAWNVGDQFTNGTFRYRVLDVDAKEVCVAGCSGSGNIIIPDVVVMEDVTFKIVQVGGGTASAPWSSAVTAVTLTNGNLRSIVADAFNGSSITTLHLPASVRVFTANTYRPAKLVSITVDASNPYFDAIDGVLYTEGYKTFVHCPNAKNFNNGAYTVVSGVDSIAQDAFGNNANLKTLNIAETLKHLDMSYNGIGNLANLSAISVNSSNPYLCSVSGVLFTKDMRTLILYPRAKTGTSYTVPNGVKEIGMYALMSCPFTSLNLNQVEILNDRSLIGCSGLTTLAIPASMKSINPAAFDNCTKLATFTVSGGTSFYATNGVLYSYDRKTLVKFPTNHAAVKFSIPNGTVTIADKAFYGAVKLTDVGAPASTTSFGYETFRGCSNLNVIYWSAVKEIGDYCFRGTAFTSITIPASLEVTGGCVFMDCTKLTTINVANGSQLKKIGNRFMEGCAGLTAFNFLGSCTLDSIGYRAFADTKLRSFTFPTSVRYIGESAFNGCTSLATVNFPADNVSLLDSIHGGAFANTAFTLTRIPSSVRCIGREAFWNVKTTATIAISSRTDSISPEAFKGCYTLSHLQVDKANTKYSSIDGMLLTKDKETLVLFPPGKANNKFTLLAPSIRKIGDYAFYQNDNLTNVVIPNRVTSLGVRSFGLCPNLNTVTMLCDNLIAPADIKQLLNEATFDDGVTTEKDYRKNIDLHLRKAVYDDYMANHYNSGDAVEDFYGKFKSINSSFNPVVGGVTASEEYIPVSDKFVDLLSTQSTNYTLVVPRTVTHSGKAYTVGLIGDYAFQNAPDASDILKEVVVFDNMEYIGAKAFVKNTGTVESIFLTGSAPTSELLSTTRFELDDTGNDYSEFSPSTKVYVKKSALDTYKTAFSRYVNGVPGIIAGNSAKFDYKIPDIKLKNTYGTFAREFDVDLSDYFAEYGTGKVYAFTSEDGGIQPGTGDVASNPTNYYIRMRSINEGGEGDGTYIPAGTGVLLKSLSGAATPDASAPNGAFYYTIGEKDINVPVASTLVGITESPQQITDPNNTTKFYVMSGGNFKALAGQTVSMPVHRAYLKLENVPTNAKVMFSFSDNPVPTEIDAFGMDEGLKMTDESPVYDLQGRKVTAPAKGLYIRNGKKVIIK